MNITEAFNKALHDEYFLWNGERYNQEHAYYKSAKRYGCGTGRFTTGYDEMLNAVYGDNTTFSELLK